MGDSRNTTVIGMYALRRRSGKMLKLCRANVSSEPKAVAHIRAVARLLLNCDIKHWRNGPGRDRTGSEQDSV